MIHTHTEGEKKYLTVKYIRANACTDERGRERKEKATDGGD